MKRLPRAHEEDCPSDDSVSGTSCEGSVSPEGRHLGEGGSPRKKGKAVVVGYRYHVTRAARVTWERANTGHVLEVLVMSALKARSYDSSTLA